MKEQILKLRGEGKTYKEIVNETGAAKSLVSYYCGDSQKEKSTNRSRRLKRKNKALAIEYKGGKCCKCGYNKCDAALEFHHRDPKEKEFSFGLFRGYKFESLKEELDKCDIVCANCHREIHHP